VRLLVLVIFWTLCSRIEEFSRRKRGTLSTKEMLARREKPGI
jgi:hypothetical protein